jgi:hypothetical protein
MGKVQKPGNSGRALFSIMEFRYLKFKCLLTVMKHNKKRLTYKTDRF